MCSVDTVSKCHLNTRTTVVLMVEPLLGLLNRLSVACINIYLVTLQVFFAGWSTKVSRLVAMQVAYELNGPSSVGHVRTP